MPISVYHKMKPNRNTTDLESNNANHDDLERERANRLKKKFEKMAERMIILIWIGSFAYGFVTIGVGIYGIIIGARSNKTNCTYAVGKLTLDVSLLVWGVWLLISGIGLLRLGCMTEEEKKKETGENVRAICCSVTFAIIWFVMLSIMLFSGNCQQKDSKLYIAGLVLFIYFWISSFVALLLKYGPACCYAVFKIPEAIIDEVI